MSDIAAKPVSWLWPGRMARGKVTIIAGNPGLGKSQITASIAAIVTTGGNWPVDRQPGTPGNAVFFSAEDDPADTLRPRLEAAGADLNRVHFIEGVVEGYSGDGRRSDRVFSLARDLEPMSQKLAELGNVAVVVIDPITAYLGETDSHKNAEVRALLAPLGDLAARHNVAIIGVSHFSKAAGAQALMRVTGSLAFVAAARAAFAVAEDPHDRERRLFLPLKNNIGPDRTGLAFRIETATVASPAGPLHTSRVSWEAEAVTITADEAVNTGAGLHEGSAFGDAREWLRRNLEDGPMLATEVQSLARAEGFSERTIKRARHALRVVASKQGMRGGWRWSLPPKEAKSPEEGQDKMLAPFDNVGPLREPLAAESPVREVEI